MNNSTEARAAFEAWYRERFPDADFSDALWRVEWYIWWAAWQAAKGESMNDRIESLAAQIAMLEYRVAQLEASLHVHTPTRQWADCGCPPVSICMNAACPRRIGITS